MQKKIYYLFIIAVAPLAGAWIEIYDKADIERVKASLLSQERGLKCGVMCVKDSLSGRSSRRSVD